MKRLIYAIAIVGSMVGAASGQSFGQAVWRVGPPAVDWQQTQFAPPQSPTNTGAPVVVNNQPPTDKVDTLPSWGTVISGLLVTLLGVYGAPIVKALSSFLLARTGAFGAAAQMIFGDRLDAMIQNGMMSAAADLGKYIDGKWVITDPTSFQARVAQYIQDHGADLIQKMGGAVGSSQFFSAIKARVMKQFANPDFPVDLGQPPAQVQQFPANPDDFFKHISDMIDQKMHPQSTGH